MLSVALLFFPVLSPAFFVLYVAGGLSDMIDGAAARRTETVSEFGSRLDTFADIVFPLTLAFMDLRYSAAVVCMAATAAAIQEGFTVHEKNCR